MKLRLWLAGVPLIVGILLSIITNGLVWAAVGAMLAFVGFQKGEELVSGATRVFVSDPKTSQLPPLKARLILPPVYTDQEEFYEPAPAAAPAPVETSRVQFKPGMNFAIGVTDTGEEISMEKLTSVWVSGIAGMGKTEDMVSLAMQSVIKYEGEVRFVVIDPHMGGGEEVLSAKLEPLAPFFLSESDFPNPVSGGRPVLVWINWLRELVEKRKHGLNASMRIVVLVDEFTDLLDDPEISAPLNKLLIDINEQSRKANIFAIVASQQLKSTRIKGTDLRNTVTTFLLHNMPPALARQVVPEEYAANSNRLKVGQAIFSSAGEQAIVRITRRTADEITSRVKPYLPMESLPPKTVRPKLNATRELRESVIETHEMFLALGYTPELATKVTAIDAFGLADVPASKQHVTQILMEGLTDE